MPWSIGRLIDWLAFGHLFFLSRKFHIGKRQKNLVSKLCEVFLKLFPGLSNFQESGGWKRND